MESIEFLPIALAGVLRLMFGSCEVLAERASSEMPMPGAITQPQKAPLLSITLILLAVPRSMTRQGRG